MKRIEQLGGVVEFNGVYRIRGLAVSRSIGDHFIRPYVTCEPEINTHNISKNDLFMIMATDGLWDVLTNEEVRDYILNTYDPNVY